MGVLEWCVVIIDPAAMIATTLYHYEFIGYIKVSLDKKEIKIQFDYLAIYSSVEKNTRKSNKQYVKLYYVNLLRPLYNESGRLKSTFVFTYLIVDILPLSSVSPGYQS